MRTCLLAFLACLCACSVNTRNDYAGYLRNNAGEAAAFPFVGGDFCYSMTERTWAHRKEIKSWLGGIVNTWVVEFGPMLDATMRIGDAQASFRSLRPATGNNACVWSSEYDLVSYDFIDNRAKIRLAVRTCGPGGAGAAREYYAEGTPQLGKMYWGKNFAMKNAVQQSTKHAVDAILAAYYTDLTGLVPRSR